MLNCEKDCLPIISGIYKISRLITEKDGKQDKLTLIIDVVVNTLAAKSGSLMLINHKTGLLYISAAKGMNKELVPKISVKPGQGIAGSVFQNGVPKLITGEATKHNTRLNEKITSALSVPVKLMGNIMGVLNVSRLGGTSPYGQKELEFAISIANQIAIVLENARLHKEKEEKIHKQNILNKDLKQAYEKLESSNEKLKNLQLQLIQSEKMSSIGQLAAGVAHEINNPVGFVNSNINTLSEYVMDIKELFKAYDSAMLLPKTLKELNESRKKCNAIQNLKKEINLDFLIEDFTDILEESKEGLKRVVNIVQNLKDFSHIDQAELKEINIISGIESTLNIIRNEIKYKTTVEKNYKDIPKIICFPQQLNQVFMNILLNASQAIKEKGKITISIKTVNWQNIEQRMRDGYTVLPINSHKNRQSMVKFIEVMISDNGSGITKENITKIFDPFFTTKEIGSGTGLGLSMSFGIIKNHKGYIGVKSQHGNGTTFVIYLPVTLKHN